MGSTVLELVHMSGPILTNKLRAKHSYDERNTVDQDSKINPKMRTIRNLFRTSTLGSFHSLSRNTVVPVNPAGSESCKPTLRPFTMLFFSKLGNTPAGIEFLPLNGPGQTLNLQSVL